MAPTSNKKTSRKDSDSEKEKKASLQTSDRRRLRLGRTLKAGGKEIEGHAQQLRVDGIAAQRVTRSSSRRAATGEYTPVQEVDSKLLPRADGKCKVYWKTKHSGEADWLGEHHQPGKWMEVKTVEDFLGEELVDLHAGDIVQLIDYRGIGAYLVAVRQGRLVLIKTGGEYGYTLPPDAYSAAKMFTYRKYYGSRHVLGYGGFIFNAELPADSTYFEQHASLRPGPDYYLYMSFLGEDPERFKGVPSEDDDEEPLFWSKREWIGANW